MTGSTAHSAPATTTEGSAVAHATSSQTPGELTAFLEAVLAHTIRDSLMIWGPPGIGKSEIVGQVATGHSPPLPVRDVRLSQLAPTDLRGLPVVDHTAKRVDWYPPVFLPTQQEPQGILFLDEMNQAPPAIQAIAQQLVLDGRVGEYVVPNGWYIWAAGNPKESRAAVFDMPAPLSNRFLHVHVRPDLASFRTYALGQAAQARIHEHILAFLSFKPDLLHRLDPQGDAWPSPRTWEKASRLYRYGLGVAPAVGVGPAAEFVAFLEIYRTLPDIDRVLTGRGTDLHFPPEVSVRYATVIGLLARMHEVPQYEHALRWLVLCDVPAEFLAYFVSSLVRLTRQRGHFGVLAGRIAQDPQLASVMQRFTEVTAETLAG
jgi:hypothetical protein